MRVALHSTHSYNINIYIDSGRGMPEWCIFTSRSIGNTPFRIQSTTTDATGKTEVRIVKCQAYLRQFAVEPISITICW